VPILIFSVFFSKAKAIATNVSAHAEVAVAIWVEAKRSLHVRVVCCVFESPPYK
jgi:hypothetical protein